MSANAETSAPPPRWPWLDRWLEPPWRALLTWVGLSWSMQWTFHHLVWGPLEATVALLINLLGNVLPVPLPREMSDIAFGNNRVLFLCWFEPVALRLNLVRSLAWLALRSVPGVVLFLLPLSVDFTVSYPVSIFVCFAPAVLVLRGWRTRPWMALIAGAMLGGVHFYRTRSIAGPDWLWYLGFDLPYAAILLYGTRRLPR